MPGIECSLQEFSPINRPSSSISSLYSLLFSSQSVSPHPLFHSCISYDRHPIDWPTLSPHLGIHRILPNNGFRCSWIEGFSKLTSHHQQHSIPPWDTVLPLHLYCIPRTFCPFPASSVFNFCITRRFWSGWMPAVIYKQIFNLSLLDTIN